MNKEEFLEFGIKREDEERRDGGCCVVFHPEIKKFAVYRNLKNDRIGLFGGGFDEGEDERSGCFRELVEESGLIDYLHTEKIDKVLTHYYNSNKGVNRVATAVCYLVILKSGKKEKTKLEEHENFDFVWTTHEEILNSWKTNNHNKDYDHWIYFMERAIERLRELGHIE